MYDLPVLHVLHTEIAKTKNETQRTVSGSASRRDWETGMNWREVLQKAVSENPYAKHAKAHAVVSKARLPNNLRLEICDAKTAPELRPETAPISWAKWKADTLNVLFQQQGRTGGQGRITAATVLHGEIRHGDSES